MRTKSVSVDFFHLCTFYNIFRLTKHGVIQLFSQSPDWHMFELLLRAEASVDQISKSWVPNNCSKYNVTFWLALVFPSHYSCLLWLPDSEWCIDRKCEQESARTEQRGYTMLSWDYLGYYRLYTKRTVCHFLLCVCPISASYRLVCPRLPEGLATGMSMRFGTQWVAHWVKVLKQSDEEASSKPPGGINP